MAERVEDPLDDVLKEAASSYNESFRLLAKAYINMKNDRDCWASNAKITDKARIKEMDKNDSLNKEVRELKHEINNLKQKIIFLKQ